MTETTSKGYGKSLGPRAWYALSLLWMYQRLRSLWPRHGLPRLSRLRRPPPSHSGMPFERARTPADPVDAAVPINTEPRRPTRDPRLPSPGSVITKNYKGRELRVTVRDDGFELDGMIHDSLTALAKTITGCKSINGWLFWGLTKRKRG